MIWRKKVVMLSHLLVLLLQMYGKCPLCKARFENPIWIRKKNLLFLTLDCQTLVQDTPVLKDFSFFSKIRHCLI